MFATMKTRTLVTVTVSLALCAALAPAAIVAERVIGQQQIADREAAFEAKKMQHLDEAGDRDGFGEHQRLIDGTTISEISIYWECATMGNTLCEAPSK